MEFFSICFTFMASDYIDCDNHSILGFYSSLMGIGSIRTLRSEDDFLNLTLYETSWDFLSSF